MMEIKKVLEPVLKQDLDEAAFLAGAEVKMYEKHIKDYAGAYADQQAANEMGDTLAYRVRSYQDNSKDVCDNPLAWGVTYMEPIKVGKEYNLTRGHFHLDRSQPEYYLCAGGEGHLIKWDGKDEVIVEKMTRGSLHWIDGKYAHRMVNTGKEVLAVIACYPVHASHDYKTIEEQGFPIRLFEENGEVKVVKVND
ncbi:MAG: glucose-6-phosphate isomerase family protein [Erysipelotrichaceae bacterium]|nr:glucose-6-phosphate isomerase family protein [Erysipelotrichaceae bacterium]